MVIFIKLYKKKEAFASKAKKWSGRQDLNLRPPGPKPGALPSCATSRLAQLEGFEPPRDLHPLSVFKTDPFSRTWVKLRVILKWWSQPESNQRHKDFQSFALPTELWDQWRSERGSNPRPPPWQGGILNQLNYQTIVVTDTGFEPVNACVKGMWVNRFSNPPFFDCSCILSWDDAFCNTFFKKVNFLFHKLSPVNRKERYDIHERSTWALFQKENRSTRATCFFILYEQLF